MPSDPPPTYTDTEGAAAYLSMSPATLETWRARGKGPAFIKSGSNVRYSYADLDAFMQANRQEPQGDE